MPPQPFCDLTLALDPTTGRCDLVFDGGGFPLDRTAQTPLLISCGSDRRAAPDDVPPGTVNDATTYSGGAPSARRGWVGDGLDPNGACIGARFWLLDDAKQLPETRLAAIDYGVEAVAWIAGLGVATAVEASWVRPELLGILVQAGSMTMSLPRSLV